MNSHRYDVRPGQRDRDGLLGLDARNPPSLGDVMLDKIVVRVPGTFTVRDSHGDAGTMLDLLKEIFQASSASAPLWGAPKGKTPKAFSVELAQPDDWTLNAKLTASLSRPAVDLGLRLGVNPTRTLRHLMPEMRERSDPIEYLNGLHPRDFFAKRGPLQQLQTPNGNDNAIVSYAEVRGLLGETFPATFIGIFDGQLRRWATEAIAPASHGFVSRQTNNAIVSQTEASELELRWPYLTVSSAETYFERRHADAAALLSRVTQKIEATHVGAMWRRYGQNELGGRLPGTEVVGLDLTKTVQFKCYAKTGSRVRIETSYNSAIRNALRRTQATPSMQEFETLCEALRRDTLARCRWEEFCDLCAEPRRSTLREAAALLSTIVEAALAEDAEPAALIATLLSTGGSDATVAGEGLTPSLARRLTQAGVLSSTNLRRRNRPGAQVRYGLAPDWLDVADRLQSVFAAED